ncbi:MAG: NusG domain II-containing protein [Clostridia bacterium]
MAQKHIDEIKKSKPFKAFDLIIYAAIVVLIIVLFCVIFARNVDELQGVEITCGESKIYEYNFADDKSQFAPSDMIKEERNGDKIFVTVTINGEFNLIEIDTAKRAVRVKDSDCSPSKECVHTPTITRSNGSIVCVPHKLVIQGVGKGQIDNPSVG